VIAQFSCISRIGLPKRLSRVTASNTLPWRPEGQPIDLGTGIPATQTRVADRLIACLDAHSQVEHYDLFELQQEEGPLNSTVSRSEKGPRAVAISL
jgi:hypothetical protein